MRMTVVDADTGEVIERDLTPAEIAERNADIAAVQEAEANRPRSVPKLTVLERMTEEEAETADAAMSTQSAKLRQIWGAAQEIRTDSPWYNDLLSFFIALFGAERSAVLLEGF